MSDENKKRNPAETKPMLSTVIFSKAMAKMAQANKHNNYDKRNNK